MSDQEGKPLDADRQIIVPEGERSGRADKLLAKLYPDLSRSRWQKLFQAGRVWQEDRVLSQKNKLRAGDVVDFSIPEVEPIELRPVEMDLSVLFEDESVLVLDKAAGVVVHPGAGTGEDTLVHGILHHCQGSLSGIGGKERPGIVHRLDKDTSGVLIIAKTDTAFQSLSEQFAGRSIRKFYTALVRGVPDPGEGTVDAPIGRHPVHRTRMSVREDGRHASTDYSVQEEWGLASLVDLQIHTGRTHQIRVHMKHLGHPVLGDSTYGYKSQEGLPEIPRVMLHASRLEFIHPVEQREIVIKAPLPEDFKAVVNSLNGD
jgi:23S rRNA pseudouridine1911/1915/1917 synthase